MQSYTSLWVHLVWSTKNRQPLIHLQLKKPLYDKMREIAYEKDFRLDFMNGIEDHVHLLVSLKSNPARLYSCKRVERNNQHLDQPE